MVYCCRIDTPLGVMTASAEEGSLTGLWFVGQKYYPAQAGDWTCEPQYPVFRELRDWLEKYFSGQECISGPRLAPSGTPFQQAVWRILLGIPYGEITTYGTIAKKLAAERALSSMSAQAVGGAVGHNPISILVPCHRVIGANGAMIGYAGGLDRKRALLQLEQVNAGSLMYAPDKMTDIVSVHL